MTAREFSEKYDIPYSTVYEGTYGVPSTENEFDGRVREYDELRLLRSVIKLYRTRKERAERIVNDADKCLNRMRKIYAAKKMRNEHGYMQMHIHHY